MALGAAEHGSRALWVGEGGYDALQPSCAESSSKYEVCCKSAVVLAVFACASVAVNHASASAAATAALVKSSQMANAAEDQQGFMRGLCRANSCFRQETCHGPLSLVAAR